MIEKKSVRDRTDIICQQCWIELDQFQNFDQANYIFTTLL